MFRALVWIFAGALILRKIIIQPRKIIIQPRRHRRLDGPGPQEKAGTINSWSTPLWEPYKVVIAAMYSLCLQRCYETVIANLNDAPLNITNFRSLPSLTSGHQVLLYQAVGFVIWLSLNFLYNMALYLLIPPDPARRRLAGHSHLTVSFGMFYLFGSTVGKPGHYQLLLILGLLLLDLVFPLFLGGVLSGRARRIWFVRGCLQFGLVLWIGWQFSGEDLQHPLFSVLFMTLMLIQLLVFTPSDIKRLRGLLRARRGQREPHLPKG